MTTKLTPEEKEYIKEQAYYFFKVVVEERIGKLIGECISEGIGEWLERLPRRKLEESVPIFRDKIYRVLKKI